MNLKMLKMFQMFIESFFFYQINEKHIPFGQRKILKKGMNAKKNPHRPSPGPVRLKGIASLSGHPYGNGIYCKYRNMKYRSKMIFLLGSGGS